MEKPITIVKKEGEKNMIKMAVDLVLMIRERLLKLAVLPMKIY